MQVKLFEVRDSMTCIPCIGIAMNEPASEAERYLLRRSGFALEEIGAEGRGCVLFGKLDGGAFHYASHKQSDYPRTIKEAHKYVERAWNDLNSGAVVDVQFVLGERTSPKVSERMEDR